MSATCSVTTPEVIERRCTGDNSDAASSYFLLTTIAALLYGKLAYDLAYVRRCSGASHTT